MGVGIQTIRKAVSLVEGLVLDHMDDIQRAYLRSDDALTISINVKLSPDKDYSGKVKIDAGIAFITERVKDTSTASVTEGMASLFDNIVSEKVTITGSEPEAKPIELEDFGADKNDKIDKKDKPQHKGHTTKVVLSEDGTPVGVKPEEAQG